MKIKNKNFVFLFVAIILLAFFICLTNISYAQDSGYQSALKGLNKTTNQGYSNSANNESEPNENSGIITDIPTSIGKVVGTGLSFIGVLFLILMIYGGFIWMFARGNEQEVTKAKDLIVSAIIGLVIVLAAYAITYYIGNILTTTS